MKSCRTCKYRGALAHWETRTHRGWIYAQTPLTRQGEHRLVTPEGTVHAHHNTGDPN